MYYLFAKNKQQSSLILPSFFSASAVDPKKKTAKKVGKIILKIFIILVYLFFFGMGLYGCFQTWTDYYTTTSTTAGNGLELGFNISSGILDPRFTLIYAGAGPWFPMSDFTMSYGPFYALFVWPFAQLLLHFMYATRDWPVGLNALLGIFLVLLIIRVITLLVTLRSTFQTEKMSEIQGKIAEINAKYKDAKDLQSKQKKNIEIQELYRKNNVKPFAAFQQIFITLPIFLIIYRVISILRPLKFISVFNAWDLSQAPLSQIFNNFTSTGWPYIFFIILVVPSQFLSQMVPRWLSKKRSRHSTTIGVKNNKAMNRTKIMNNVLSIFMAIITVISASGIGVYWFFNSIFSMLQSLVVHKIIMHRRNKNVTIESKLSKLGIE